MMLLLDARGQVRVAAGDISGGLADLLICGERIVQLRADSPGMIAWRTHAAGAYLQLGTAEQARALAEEELTLARRLCGPLRKAGAMRVLARSTEANDALALLTAAAESLVNSPGTLEGARVAADHGALLRRRRQLPEARKHLASALHDATVCGARSLAQFAREEPLAAGGRPRRPHLLGLESLTPSELRVAKLAGGATNTSIAQTLFLSRKTVEKYLAYRKLAIDARSELPTPSHRRIDERRHRLQGHLAPDRTVHQP